MKKRDLYVVVTILMALFGLALLYPAVRGPAPAPFAKTGLKLAIIETALHNYWTEYEEFPHGDFREVLSVLQAKNTDGQNPRKIVFLELRSSDFDKDENLVDGWGRPFDFTVSGDHGKITIKSLGENGVDDHGDSDDMLIEVVPPRK